MKSKTLGLLIVIVMVVLSVAPVSAAPALDRTAPDTGEPGVYIVRFEGASLASYEGGITGLEATSPAATGAAKLDVKSPASVAYLGYLDGKQDQFIAAMERTLDRSVDVLFRYDVVLNGMAVRLTAEEAAQVATLQGVIDVQPESIEYPDTDAGPTWIGAPGIWNGTAVPGGIGTQGEGVIVGVIDTGINHDHPSFADIGGDAYDHTNPWGSGNYVGYCVTNPSFCNDKLIGAWNFAGDGPEDTDGHGSHTSSTAAGNHITANVTTPSGYVVSTPISGVAPHANIVMYDACVTSCAGSALLASAQQALIDGVDVINYSISGGNNPYGDSVELAFLDLNTAGVFVSTSAGNAGPPAATVAHRSAWVSTVAAATHNRLYTNDLINLTGDGTPPADISGQSISTGYGPAPIVYAGDAPYNNPLCADFGGTVFSGQIVVCDRGTYGRVEKGQNVLNAGGGGYILANDAANGDSLVADPHALPAIHISYNDGVVLKAWLATGTTHIGTITTTSTDLDPINGDILASFSSRGPNTTFDVLKPDMVAPGVAILAAYKAPEEITWLGGTSMSSPHNAGAGALMKALYPSWSPSEIKSAIMTTSWTQNLRKEDGVTPADPFDVGAGRDNLLEAAKAGIVFDESRANYQAANPSLGGDPKTLNMPSLQDSGCGGSCSWTRTVKSTQSTTVTWTAAGTGMGFGFSPASFDLAPGATQQIVITADATGLPLGTWAFGEVTLTPSDTSIPVAHLPVAVVPTEAAPAISVEPGSFDTTQQVDTSVTHPLVISNVGTSALDWSIFEDAGVLGGAVLVDWSDNFDSYPVDTSLQGLGGWKGWGNDPAAAGYTRDEQARSAPNSVEIVNLNDTVHEYSGYTSGTWIYTAWQYLPTGFTGEHYFILLNQYDDAGTTNNWSTQVDFNSSTGQVVNTGSSGGSLPLINNQWVEIRVEIDLDADTQSFYYGGNLLYSGSWTGEVSGGGIANIAAVDLWGNSASSVYYDDLSLVSGQLACSAPSDIPWVSVDPTSGTTPQGGSSAVDVTFDTTGLTVGNTYNGNLCIDSNDPAQSLVVVPLALTVVSEAPVISVDPDSLHSTQFTDMIATLPLSICNTGDAALSWTLIEQPVAARTSLPALPQVTPPHAAYNPDAVVDLAGGAEPAAPAPDGAGVIWNYPEAVLWDNGPLVTHPAACSGMDASRLQTDLSMNTLGFGNQYLYGYRMADDFEVTGGDWQIDQITFFAYQTGAPTSPSPITGVYYQIWNGPPNDPASSVVFGDLTTNRLVSSANPNLQRDSGTSPCANNRYIFANVASAGVTLPPGTYWLDWMTDGSLSSGPWAPPVTILGQTTTGNALQYTTAWAPANDTGTLTQQDMPFIIEGGSAGDVPWLSEDPIVGIVEPGLCQLVDVSFDSTGMAIGDYMANLIADSNDPVTPQVVVPVTMTVIAGEPDVVVEPLELTAEVCADSTEVITFTVCNTGLVPLDWTLAEVPPAGVLVFPQTAAASVPRTSRTVELGIESSPVPNGSVTTEPPATNAAVDLVLDDGSVENNIGIGGTWEFIFLNRFTPDPGVYPFYLNQVQVYFDIDTAVAVGDDIIVVVYENTAGNADPAVGANWLASFPATVQELGAWNVYDLATPVFLNGPGDVLIGVVALEVPGVAYYPAALDQTASQQRSWAGWWLDSPPPTPPTLPPDDSWTLIDAYFPGNWMIRGYGETYDIPWLSEDPTAGTVQPGACQEVAVTFDATGMTPGDYAGALLLASNDPDTPEITIPVTMTIPEPADIVSVTYTVNDLEVTFDATVSGTAPFAYAWDFGDGGTADVEDPVHVYAAGGTYPFTLTVSNDCGEDTWTGEVTVCEPVHGLDFSWLPAMPAVDEDVVFTATAMGTDPITFAWDFGDGQVGAGITATHVYTMAGDYVVTVTATNCDGASEVVTDTITVAEAPVTMWRTFLPIIVKGYQP